MATTFTLISSNTLSGTASSVTFSNIPGTYTDLILKMSVRTEDSSIWAAINLTFNGASTNYSWRYMGANGSGVNAASGTDTSYIVNRFVGGNTATANTFSSGELYIPSYTVSQNKPVSGFQTTENNATASYMMTLAGLWRNTAAITSITMVPDSGPNFMSGSSFYLYGISKN